MCVLLAGGCLDTHTGKAGLVKAELEALEVCLADSWYRLCGGFKSLQPGASSNRVWGDNSGLTDMSVQKLKCVVSG